MTASHLLTFAGPDTPRLLPRICNLLEEEGAALLDIEQVVVARHVASSFAVGLAAATQERVLQRLDAAARALGLSLHAEQASAAPVSGRERYALTAISRALRPGALGTIAQTLADHGAAVERVFRLSERGLSAVELAVSLPSSSDAAALKRALLAAASAGDWDFSLQRESLLRRSKRLVVMDMDSTLIRIEVIDELARAYGVYDQVSGITARAMRGELDYDQSLRERVALLRGLDARVLHDLAANLPLMEGAETLLRVLKRLGYRTAILSGGFSVAAQALQARLGIDHAWSNTLEIEEGKLSGRVVGPIVNAQRKADLLEELAAREGIPLDQVIAVGDGANDLLMLQKAGHGIAFHAKPKLREAAHTAISAAGLDAVLYLLGISGREISALVP